ncbi:CHAT domain-containing protein [Oscillatoria amoena NRMC-F 0135]|nr:CHAT domain-containing protein [Oscillatoria amoena NRMC-F 0135]
MSKLLRLIFLLVYIQANAQNTPEWRVVLDSARLIWYQDFDKTTALVDRAEKLIVAEGPGKSVSALFECYEIRIAACDAFNRLQLWRSYKEKADSFLLTHKEDLGSAYFTYQLSLQFNTGQYYLRIGDYDRSLQVLSALLNEYKKLARSAEVCNYLHLLSNEIAAIYIYRSEYEAAVNQRLAGLEYFQCYSRFSESQQFPTLTYRNLAQAYQAKGDRLNAFRYLKLAEESGLAHLKKSPEEAVRVAITVYESLAEYYINSGFLDSARLSITKALPLLQSPSLTNSFRGRIYFSLGNVYLKAGEYPNAMNAFRSAEQYFHSDPEDQRMQLSNLYIAMAQALHDQSKTKLALQYCEKAINLQFTDYRADADGNPLLENMLSKKLLFEALQKKYQLLDKLATTQHDSQLQHLAFKTNRLTLALLDSMINELSLDADRIILSERSHKAFEEGILIGSKLYARREADKQVDELFTLIEKSKGILLLENLRQVNRFSGISAEWIIRERELKAEMLVTEELLYKAELSRNSEVLIGLRERYADLKEKHAALLEKMKVETPNYYKLRFDHSTISATAVQHKLLKPNEALVEFFVGDSILAVTGFTAKKRYLDVKTLPQDFATKINAFRFALMASSDKTFNRFAFELYDLLLKDCLVELGEDINALTIIPDGLLGYIPFEVLRPSQTEDKHLNDKVSIHYAHSATYLAEQLHRKPAESKYFFAGFVASGLVGQAAPSAVRDRKLTQLRGAEHEVASIVDLIPARFRVFNPASKTDFISYAPDYRVLHLAMHSIVNDANPMMSEMIFAMTDSSEYSLTAGELYSMQLNSQLAVLSACNTGMGHLHRGEGIMSFSRAFAYAGVPSAVISLWKVPDEATSKIMIGFYRYLKNGETKPRALQLARQEFVRDNPDYSHPYFWAGFILTGNAEPIDFPNSTWMWFLLFAGTLLIVAAVFRKRIATLTPKYFPSKSA